MVILVITAIIAIILFLPIFIKVEIMFWGDFLPFVTVYVFGIKVHEVKIKPDSLDSGKKPPIFLIKAFNINSICADYTCGYVKLADTFSCAVFACLSIVEKLFPKFVYAQNFGGDEREIFSIDIAARTSIFKILTVLLSKKGISYAKSN